MMFIVICISIFVFHSYQYYWLPHIHSDRRNYHGSPIFQWSVIT
jgi:hypothetical protein